MECFEGGKRNRETAVALRVSERSVERWRRTWRECGDAGSGRRDLRAARGPVRPRPPD
ncbi:helix-turn-helix domain-containing protein [Streptomyces sp. NPDC017868]|uniref:helix-turn-helix domain-containing protein n=1 Tax=Streptomyces sp. NPDC017868 TaxID=3365014 RepID=UPI0037BD5742